MNTLERACAVAGLKLKRGLTGRYVTDGTMRCRVKHPLFREWLAAALMERVFDSDAALAGYHRRTLHTSRDTYARIAAAVSALEGVDHERIQ